MFATDFADMDADGDLDLASHSFGCCNGLHVYRNEGNGTWTQTWSRSGGNAQSFLCWGDVNGDGRPDLAASYQNGTIFLGNGEGGFAPADVGLPAPGLQGLSGVCLGDVDVDGCADLAFVQGGGVFVYLWRADHWVSASTGLPASGGYEAAQLWDLNADGFLDVAAMDSGMCSIWLGDGAGGWTPGGGFLPGPAVDVAAFRTGGDVDHNGFADFVFVQEEGSFPNYHNELYVFRESSVPSSRFALFQFPRGNEAFCAGSVQTVRWSSAQVGGAPASATLELSADGPHGPWTTLATALPDNGAYQWAVAAPPTSAATLRVVVTQGAESATAVSRTFRILSGSPTDAPDRGAFARGGRLVAWPNPSGASIRFLLAGGGAIRLYDVTGRKVRDLVARDDVVEWDGADSLGRLLPAGVYFATASRDGVGEALEAPRFRTDAVRVVLVR
jgi:hypothetical protein